MIAKIVNSYKNFKRGNKDIKPMRLAIKTILDSAPETSSDDVTLMVTGAFLNEYRPLVESGAIDFEELHSAAKVICLEIFEGLCGGDHAKLRKQMKSLLVATKAYAMKGALK